MKRYLFWLRVNNEQGERVIDETFTITAFDQRAAMSKATEQLVARVTLPSDVAEIIISKVASD